jgi:aerobic carbon-monoxide dehydrogenase small subunit
VLKRKKMHEQTIHLTINGKSYTPTLAGNTTLLEYLRDNLRLTGTKDGCKEGECGACTVIMNGEAVKSCLVLALQADGAVIETVEGLVREEGYLHPLQQAFMEVGAVQCGFCTPGMLMTAKAYLKKNGTPTHEQIRSALSGNLCRCTGYVKIVQAVTLAASRMVDL